MVTRSFFSEGVFKLSLNAKARHITIILKWSHDFLLYTKKETSSVLFTIKYCFFQESRSVLSVRAIQFTFH